MQITLYLIVKFMFYVDYTDDDYSLKVYKV